MQAVFYLLIAGLAGILGYAMIGIRHKRPVPGTAGALVLYGLALAAVWSAVEDLFGPF